MPNPPLAKRVLQNVTPKSVQRQPKSDGNGQQGAGLDPKIIKMADFLDRAIRSQNPTVGTVIAAIGILLGRKSMNPDNLKRLINDVNSAIRVGFYLHSVSKDK